MLKRTLGVPSVEQRLSEADLSHELVWVNSQRLTEQSFGLGKVAHSFKGHTELAVGDIIVVGYLDGVLEQVEAVLPVLQCSKCGDSECADYTGGPTPNYNPCV